MNTKISGLSSGVPAQSTDLVPIARAGANYSLPLSGVFTGIGSAVILADNMAGADWGAKVQAADTQLGATAGEIWITQAAGTSAPAANITLNNGHVLRFLQGGTWALGTHSIVIPAGVLGAAIIGSGGLETTGLTYTGTGFAIVVGAAGATLTEGITLQDLFIQCQSTSDNAGCVQLLATLFVNLIRCALACNVAHAQYGVLSDGTGNFSAFTSLQNCAINLAKFGVKFTGSSNSNLILGGSITGNVPPVAGSIGVNIDAGDSCNIISGDIETYATGIVLNSSHTLINAIRFESNTLDINFTSSATSNKIFTIDASGTLNVTNSGGATNQVLYSDKPIVTPLINAMGNVTGAGVSIDLSLGNVITMTLTGNVTSSSFANATPGQEVTFIITQDGAGGHTFSWPSAIVPAGIAPYPATNINAVTVAKGVVDASGNVNFENNGGGITVFRGTVAGITASDSAHGNLFTPTALGHYRITTILYCTATGVGGSTMTVLPFTSNGNGSGPVTAVGLGNTATTLTAGSIGGAYVTATTSAENMGYRAILTGTIGTAIYAVDVIIDYLGN